MPLSSLPSVDRVLRSEEAQALVRERGRTLVTDSIRQVLAEVRTELQSGDAAEVITEAMLVERVRSRVEAHPRPSLRPVFNLTGTVLHTNQGRSPLPAEAIDAMVSTARVPSNDEFDLERGSRGELIEIGGSFRLPEIMARAGCRLREVGTTNRVHRDDYEQAIGPKTGLVMKVHTSNYAIVGFTSSVAEAEIAALCHERGVPFVVDLGSGTLIDLAAFGLPHEPTPAESLRYGADIVTFSGDKLLGGPQAGIIVGRADLVRQIRKNPLKRALRVDKITVAALTSVLSLYLDPDTIAERLPVLRLLTRPLADVRAAAERLAPLVASALQDSGTVTVIACASEIGSGALPTREIASAGLAIHPPAQRSGRALTRIAAAFRQLPVPVIGRIQDDAFILDLRCLDDEATFVEQLPRLGHAGAATESTEKNGH